MITGIFWKWLAIALGIVLLVSAPSSYFLGRMHENADWAEVAADLDAQIQALKDAAAAREKRDRASSAQARQRVKAETAAKEKERAKWIADARAAWAAELDRLRVDETAPGVDPALALSACRAERDATRAGLERVLTAGELARAACDRDRTQLGSLLIWLNGVTR